MSVHRLFELDYALQFGILYPRFGLNLNFGYGALLFHFYPPLASYVGLLFHALGMGFIAATKSVAGLGLFFGSIGVYVYTRQILNDRPSALISAVLYLLSPYLLTVIYERGAVAESLAWGITPWLFWTVHTYVHTRQKSRGLVLALFVAAVVLAHNATAIFILPFVAAYALLALIINQKITFLPIVLGVFLLGVGLSAFYWLPAIADIGLTYTREFMLTGDRYPVNNVVSFFNLVQHHVVHQYAGDERFRFSLWQMLFSVFAVVILGIRRKTSPATLWVILGIWIVVMLLQTEFSLPFWKHVPLVDSIQFPWRLLGLASFCSSVLIGSMFVPFHSESTLVRGTRLAAGVGFVMVTAWLATANMDPAKSPIWQPIEESWITREGMWERGAIGYAMFGDYTVKTLKIDNLDFNRSRPSIERSEFPPVRIPNQLDILAYDPLYYRLAVNADDAWTLRLHRPYFPGWRATIDGAPLDVRVEGVGGLVSAEIPAGNHEVTIWFGDSAIVLFANLLSTVSLTVWLTWAIAPRRKWIFVGLAVIVSGAAIGGNTLVRDTLRTENRPIAHPATFANELKLLAYDLPSLSYCAGDSIPVGLSWFVGSTPPIDYKIFLHLSTLDDNERVAQVDSNPFSGYNPMTRWEAGELIIYEQPVPLGVTTPPGRYQLLIGVYHPETLTNLAVSDTDNVLPGDRLRLSEIEVRNCSK